MLEQSLGSGGVFSPTEVKPLSGPMKRLCGNPERTSGLVSATAVNPCKCLTLSRCCEGNSEPYP